MAEWTLWTFAIGGGVVLYFTVYWLGYEMGWRDRVRSMLDAGYEADLDEMKRRLENREDER